MEGIVLLAEAANTHDKLVSMLRGGITSIYSESKPVNFAGSIVMFLVTRAEDAGVRKFLIECKKSDGEVWMALKQDVEISSGIKRINSVVPFVASFPEYDDFTLSLRVDDEVIASFEFEVALPPQKSK